MKANIGVADKMIRISIAISILILHMSKIISGLAGIILMIFSGILLVTSFLSFCPIYGPLEINTCSKKQQKI